MGVRLALLLVFILSTVASFAADGDLRYMGCNVIAKHLREGIPMPAAWVVTHQNKPLTAATVKAITEDPRHAGKPVIILNSDVYHDLDPRQHLGLHPRTVEVESTSGYIFKNKLIAGEIHLAGGNCGQCLSNTVQHIMRVFVASESTQVKFVAHKSLIYGDYEPIDGVPFVNQLIKAKLPIPNNGEKTVEIIALNPEKTRYSVRIEGYPTKKIEVELVP